MSDQILVIKLGALGDFVQAAGPFAAIRDHHRDDSITLLTSRPFAAFAAASPWFDQVWTDTRPKLLQVAGWLGLRRRLRAGHFDRVYDLQTSDRSGFYYKLFWPDAPPEWSGIAARCSHPHANPQRDFMHTMDRQGEQLAMAGVGPVSAPEFSWVEGSVERFGLAEKYAVIAPCGADHRPEKRWPITRYSALARHLAAEGLQPVFVGGVTERELIEVIASEVSGAKNLAGKTKLEDLFSLARGAQIAVGNDTGPMHVFAVAGTPTLVLYSAASDPALCAQRGEKVTILRRDRLGELDIEEVTTALPPDIT